MVYAKFVPKQRFTKRCAVCGDTTKLNVRLAWRRIRDGKTVNVCCACAEAGAVNENSIDNYTTKDTLYKEEKTTFEDMYITDFPGRTRAFVKVQDGCENYCSYCIIPYARGRIRSRKIENVISEITDIAQKGIKEVVITGIHVASYGRDFKEEYKLIDLLEEINEKISHMNVELEKNNLLTQQNIETSKELSNTMSTIKDTMITMTESIKHSNKVSEDLSHNVDKLSNQIKSVDEKFEQKVNETNDKIKSIDDKSKIDIVEVQKESIKGELIKYFVTGGLGLGIGAFIIKLLESLYHFSSNVFFNVLNIKSLLLAL